MVFAQPQSTYEVIVFTGMVPFEGAFGLKLTGTRASAKLLLGNDSQDGFWPADKCA
jgi:hypothetical protein